MSYADVNIVLEQLTPKFKEALLAWVGDGAVTITAFYDSAYDRGGCETCGPDIEQTVEVSYERGNGTRGLKTYQGSFLDILGYLV